MHVLVRTRNGREHLARHTLLQQLLALRGDAPKDFFRIRARVFVHFDRRVDATWALVLEHGDGFHSAKGAAANVDCCQTLGTSRARWTCSNFQTKYVIVFVTRRPLLNALWCRGYRTEPATDPLALFLKTKKVKFDVNPTKH